MAPVCNASHDYTYGSRHSSTSQPTQSRSEAVHEEIPSEIQVILDSVSTPVFTIESLNISLVERERIEQDTRKKSTVTAVVPSESKNNFLSM